MTKVEHIEYWKATAEKDWGAAQVLLKKRMYPQALFFGHLVLEKLLKAHFVKDNAEDFPPKTHNLVRLAAKTALEMNEDDFGFLEEMNDYQLEGRYPDYLLSIYRTATKSVTVEVFEKIDTFRQWLLSLLP
ncbi:MAG: HEPN domain-containing protein [Saprospiraceae bacterium]